MDAFADAFTDDFGAATPVTIPNQTGTPASSTTTTAGATPVTRYGVAVPGFGGGTDNAAFWVPDAAMTAATVTVVIAAHGAGNSNTFADATTGPQGTMRQYLLDAGYCVLALNMHGDTFGNQTAQSDVAAAWRWLRNIVGWDVANLVLWGESMGGGAITAAYALGSIPKDRVACMFLAAPLVNYTYLPAGADPALVSAFNAAYGATDDTSRTANSHDFDPMRRPVADYAGLRVWISSSTQDTTVVRDQNALAFLAKIAGTAVSGTDYQTTGGHVSAQHYAYTNITSFVASSLTAETAEADNVPYVPGAGDSSLGFTPQSVPGLTRWSRADDYAATGDGLQFTSGSVVDRGNAGTSWAPGTAGSGPTYRASVAALGNQPALEFDGTVADALAELNTTTTLPSTGYTVYAVHARAATGGGTTPALVSQDQITTNRVVQLGFSTATPSQGRLVAFTNATATARTDAGTTLATKTTPAVFTGSADTTMSEIWSNGTSAGATTTPTGLYTTARRLIVGAAESTNTTYPFAGHIAEWGVFDHVLTAAERSTLHSYVQDRYGPSITVSDYTSSGVVLTATRSDAAGAVDAVTTTFTAGGSYTASGVDVAGGTDAASTAVGAARAAADVAAAIDAVTATLTSPISLVSATSTDSGATAVTSMAIAGPPAPATFAVMFVGRSGGLSTGALSGVSDTAGNTWRMATRGAVSGATSTRLEVWYCDTYTPATTVTAASSASQTSGWLIAGFTGVVSATALDVASPDNSASAAGATVSTPAVTTTVRDLLLAADQHGGGTTGSGPASPWIALGAWNVSTTGGGNAGYLVADTAGSYSATFTQGGTGAAGVAIAAFKVAQAAPTGTNYTPTATDAAGVVDAATAVQSQASAAADAGAAVDAGVATQTLTRTATDTAGAVDTVTAQTSAVTAAADTAAAVDTVTAAAAVAQASADTAGVTDVVTPIVTATQTATDTAGAVDAATATQAAVRTPADVAGAVDAVTVDSSAAGAQTVADAAGGVDSVAAVQTITATAADAAAGTDAATSATGAARTGGDTAAATDAAAAAQSITEPVADTAGAADAWSATIAATGSAADTAAATDSATATLTGAAQYADTAAGVDAWSATIAAARTIADAAGAADAVNTAAAVAQTVADLAAAADAATAVQALAKPVGDAAAAADAITATLSGAGQYADVAAAVDAVSVVVAGDRTVADVAGGVDAIGVALGTAKAVGDTAAAVDAATSTQAQQLAPADTAGAVDSVDMFFAGAAQLAVADTAAATDTASISQAAQRALTDAAGVVDGVSWVMTRVVVIVDAADAADAVAAVAAMRVTRADTAGAVDILLPTFDVAALTRYEWRLRYGRVDGRLRATTVSGTLRGRD